MLNVLIRSMPKGYIVFIGSVHLSVCPSICPSVIPSNNVNPFYNQVLLQSFFITYNSAATNQKLFIFRTGLPERHGGARGKI